MAAIGTVSAVLGLVSQSLSMYKPAERAVTYKGNRSKPNNLPDVPTIVTLYMRKKLTHVQFFDQMRAYGYNDSTALQIYNATIRYLDITDYIVLYRRQEINHSELIRAAERVGFDLEELDLLMTATEFFPTPGDMIRFAVREVYTPNIVRQYGMMDDIPIKFLQEAGKVGMLEEQARNYWASHWELPSIQMGYAMMHRSIIDNNDLHTLLKALDVMPYWRDKLIKLSYNPLTRVDVGRMYGLDVLNYEQVIEAYQHIGYSPTNAKRMADFTVKYENNEMDGLTRANIIKSYKNGLISQETLLQYLQMLRYSPAVVDFWYNFAVYEKTVTDIKDRKEELKTAFLDGILTLQDVTDKLIEEGANSEYLNTVLTDFKRAVLSKQKLPSLETLIRWVTVEVIDEYMFSSYMRRLGYTDDVIMLYLVEALDIEKPVQRKFLKESQYIGWYQTGIINRIQLEETLIAMRFSRDDITIMMTKADESMQKEDP